MYIINLCINYQFLFYEKLDHFRVFNFGDIKNYINEIYIKIDFWTNNTYNTIVSLDRNTLLERNLILK